jgi:hypothetical protein
MSIVSGVALDEETDHYKITYEMIDLTKPVKQRGLTTILLDSEGDTIFDAIRNVKKKLRNKIYFGHMMTVILSEDIAKSKKIGQIANWFLRDSEGRETMYFVVSKEKSAAEIQRCFFCVLLHSDRHKTRGSMVPAPVSRKNERNETHSLSGMTIFVSNSLSGHSGPL